MEAKIIQVFLNQVQVINETETVKGCEWNTLKQYMRT